MDKIEKRLDRLERRMKAFTESVYAGTFSTQYTEDMDGLEACLREIDREEFNASLPFKE